MLSKKPNLHITTMPLVDWIEHNEEKSTSIWNRQWTMTLQRGDKEELEKYLSSFCYSVLDLSSDDQVFVVRTAFISVITDLLRIQSKKQALQPNVLSEAYKMIGEIESWENLSQFILGIPAFLDVIIENILFYTPFYGLSSRMDEAIRLINEHITDRKLTVQWLANEIGISTTHLSNLFRIKLGMNPSEYIAKRKVAEIANDIVHTSKSLAEIREKYGFISHSHFIQFFKRHKGKTPLKYRQHILNITDENE